MSIKNLLMINPLSSHIFPHRVMVLDAGKIVEFDSPSVLFEKQGHFYSLAKEAGVTSITYTVL